MSYFGFADWPEIELDDDPMLPIGGRPELPWLGFPSVDGNDGHPSDLYDSLEADQVGKNTEALYYSLTGQRLTETTDPVTQHNHKDEGTLIDWLPLWRWSPANGLADNAVGNGHCIVTNTSEKTLGYGIFVLPSGNLVRPTLFPRMRATIPGQGSTEGTLYTRWRIYTAVSTLSKEFGAEIVSPTDLGMYASNVFNRNNEWIEGDPFTWLGATVPPVAHRSGKYVFYIKVSVWVTAGDALLSELQLAQRSWGS